MITMDDLFALTKSEVNVKDEKRVTLVLDPHTSAEEAVSRLVSYFGQGEQKAVKLRLEGQDRGYMLRSDIPFLMTFGTRGVDDSAGATLPGDPSHVTLTELCCPTAGCGQVLLVTNYDENDPPTCDDHDTAMERCK